MCGVPAAWLGGPTVRSAPMRWCTVQQSSSLTVAVLFAPCSDRTIVDYTFALHLSESVYCNACSKRTHIIKSHAEYFQVPRGCCGG